MLPGCLLSLFTTCQPFAQLCLSHVSVDAWPSGFDDMYERDVRRRIFTIFDRQLPFLPPGGDLQIHGLTVIARLLNELHVVLSVCTPPPAATAVPQMSRYHHRRLFPVGLSPLRLLRGRPGIHSAVLTVSCVDRNLVASGISVMKVFGLIDGGFGRPSTSSWVDTNRRRPLRSTCIISSESTLTHR